MRNLNTESQTEVNKRSSLKRRRECFGGLSTNKLIILWCRLCFFINPCLHRNLCPAAGLTVQYIRIETEKGKITWKISISKQHPIFRTADEESQHFLNHVTLVQVYFSVYVQHWPLAVHQTLGHWWPTVIHIIKNKLGKYCKCFWQKRVSKQFVRNT